MTVYFFKFPLVPTLGGAEFHTLKLAAFFKSQGHDIKLYTSDLYLFRLFEKNNLPRKRMFVGWEPTAKWSLILWPLTWLIARFRLKKIIRAAPPGSILYCQSLIEKLIVPSLLTTYNLQLTAVFIEHKIPGRWLKLNPLKFLYLNYSKKVKIITVSNFAKQEFIRFGVLEKNIEIIYPSISPFPGPPQAERVRERSNQFTIGILGRLDPEKGTLGFLNLVIPGLTRNPSWKILIAGTGSEENDIRQLINNNNLGDRIQLLGFVHNLGGFFSQISVLAYPTLVPESFGMAILEAQSRGIPVIASNIGAIPEIITHGKNGFLVDNETWIKYLEELQNPELYKKMSERHWPPPKRSPKK